MFTRFVAFLALFAFLVAASPFVSTGRAETIIRRTDPVFPPSPASCPICEKGYPTIQSCAKAAPVLSNFSMIIFNPGAFLDVIKCACGDTFQSVFPQCVDCFTQTGQQDVISTSDLPGLVGSIKNICGLESTLLGNVSAVNSANPQPTQSSDAVAGLTRASVAGYLTALLIVPFAAMLSGF